MKPLLIFSLMLLTSCSYFKKQQQHSYDLRYTNKSGSIIYYKSLYFRVIERNKDWLVWSNNETGNRDTLFISNRKDLSGMMNDFRPGKLKDLKFSGKIIDESIKSLHIKGEFFEYNPLTEEYFFAGVLELD